MPRDLFGEIPVCWDDVCVWLRAVPGIDPDSRRALAYIRSYNVVDKVRACKQAGAWPPTRRDFQTAISLAAETD